MALDLFKLLGTIEVDNSKANQALDETSNKGQQTQSKMSKALGAVGKGAAVAGKAIMTGLAAGGAAMAGLTAKALGAAGELEQNMGGSEAVFGKYADKMQVKAKDAFSNMGLSTSDYLATANKMGALFQGAGFDIEESMNLSSDAMQRAADVASIMGIDTGAAMEAIAGAAKGNFTMMDNLGVAMNDTTLQAYALEKGINKSTTEMTNQEKIGLAMEMFMEKTAYAAGNYAKENETLAGSLGTAKAALTNFLDGSGDVESLVSSFGNLANVAVKSLQEILPRLTTGITEIINQVMPMLPPLLDQLLPALVEGATSLINGLVSALPGILNALMGALPALIQGVETIMNALITALPQIMEALVSALPTLIPLLINGLVTMIVTLCTMLPQIIQPIIDYLPEIIVSVVNALLQNLPALIMGVGQLILGLVAAFPQILVALWEAIKGIFTSIAQMIGNFFEPVKNAVSNAWNALGSVPGLSSMKAMIEQVWGAIKNHITVVINAIKNVVTTVWNAIKNVVSTVINSIKNVITTVWNAIKTIITNVMKLISSVLKGDWEGVKAAISNIINAIKSVITSVWNAIKNVISSVMNGIKSVISSIWNAIKSVITSAVNTVKSVISSVWNGIKNTTSSVFNGIKTTASKAWNDIKEKMTQPIETAKNKIKGIVDTVKGFFSGMKLSFPKIKMPHFSISPSGWKIGDLLKGSIPKLGIDWYAKAMQNPIVMTKPTIWGYDPETGNLKGGGEAGSEVVSGTNTLMNMIQTAVAAQNDAVVYYLQRLIELLAEFFPQIMDEFERFMPLDPDSAAAVLAVPMNRQLGRLTAQKGRGR